MALMGLYLHLGPFSRYVVQQIELKIEEIERDGFDPRRAPAPPTPALVSPHDGSGPATANSLANLPPVPAAPDRAAYGP
jgi:hypothetical protein